MKKRFALIITLLLTAASTALAQTTSFTYQGKLSNNNTPATGNYDFEFRLFDALTNGVQQGTTQTVTNIAVTGGIFTVTLDFGACASCFNGAARFLDISVRATGGGTYTQLSPRQAVTSNPYTIRSLNATTADTAINSLNLGDIPANQFVLTNDPRLSDDRNPQPGSPNYVQNTTLFQSPGNFNIAGAGKANIFDATTQFNIGGSPALRFQLANANIFVGNTGQGGVENSFFGYQAGLANQTACCNSFFGRSAGVSNTLGIRNSFFGLGAGFSNTTGSENTAVGDVAGDTVTVGSKNTFLGAFADAGANNLSNATAIGAYAQVTQSNALVLGSINGVNGASADTNVGIGTTAPQARLTVSASSTNAGDNTATFSAPNIGANLSHVHFGTTGDWYIRSAAGTGKVILQDLGGNVGIGTSAPADKLVVSGGFVRILLLGSGGGTNLCWNVSNQISFCSSSRRYKTNIAALHTGLSLVHQLRPVTFDWKQNGEPDLGLVAEEVAKVEPLLVTHNAKGEIEGVKYDRVGVLLINAVKEQQTQIEAQRRLIDNQQQQLRRQDAQLEALKRLVCTSHRKNRRCR